MFMDPDSGNLSFSEYLSSLRGRGPATVRAYLRDLSDFEAWSAARGSDGLSQLSRSGVGLYLMWRMEERRRHEDEPSQLSARSAARSVSALKVWGQYLVFSGVLSENPVDSLSAPKYSR